MARHWNRGSAFLSLVLLLQLALSVVSVGDSGTESCPSYPEDITWKQSFNPTELTNIRFGKKMYLRLEGTFKQPGPTVLLHKPESGHNLQQIVKMKVNTVKPSNSRDVFNVGVILTLGFRSRDTYPLYDASGTTLRASHEVKLVGDGTFHDSTGELCVIGCITEGVCNYQLRLKYPAPKTILNVTVEGHLSSIGVASDDAKYFDPVSIHAFADAPFEYTKNATLASVCPSLPRDVKSGKFMNYDEDSDENVCFGWNHLLWQSIEVTWDPKCGESTGAKSKCSPFTGIGNSASAQGGNQERTFLRFQRNSCQGKRMQANLLFSNSSFGPFGFELTDPTATDGTLLAEGTWDFETGQMCMIACRLYGQQDCEIAVTAQFPLTYTATQRSAVIGHVQSLRNETDPLYFKRITFRTFTLGSSQWRLVSSFEEDVLLTNSKNKPEYVYTKVATAKAHCAGTSNEKKKLSSSSGNYPSGEMWSELELTVVKDLPNLGGKVFNALAQMNILTLGKEFIKKTYDDVQHKGANVTGLGLIGSSPLHPAVQDGIMNVSYMMDYKIGQQKPDHRRRGFRLWQEQGEGIAGEGFYDSNTGKLCLIGCRPVDLKQKGLKQLEGEAPQQKDCQTLFNIQLPPKESSQILKGTVTSLREDPHDPLYFPPESFSGFTNRQTRDTSWRMDLEMGLSVLMLAFTVAFLLKQVFYSQRHRETLPYISITMVLLLCLAHMIPLVLDFESLLNQTPRFEYNHLIGHVGRWPKVNRVVVRFLTLLAMLLELRLLQLVWKSRTDPNSSTPSVQEKKLVLYYLAPLCIAGGLVAILLHAMAHFKPYEQGFRWRSHQGGVWWDVHAYVGLLMDFHLLPQVMANVFWDESAATTPTTPTTQAPPLTKLFFMGTALVRSLPHLYDLGRQFRFIPSFSDMYLYANPEWEFFSVCADVSIPVVVVLLTLLVALQQRFGGRYVLPRRWRWRRSEKQQYERVENPVADVAL